MTTLRMAQRAALQRALRFMFGAAGETAHIRIGDACLRDGQVWPCGATVALTDGFPCPWLATGATR